MLKQKIVAEIKKKKSFLCVGLDTDMTKLPAHFNNSSHRIFDFNKELIDATHDLCVSYKLNTAFYEAHGLFGWEELERTVKYIKLAHPNHFLIADAKRGDIGNTSKMYAQAFFNHMDVDAITVAPYMGKDSVEPFLEFKHKWAILLALTSNSGADDFELAELKNNSKVYEQVISVSKEWGTDSNLMYVVGATRPEMLAEIRKIVPGHFFLVPGVGAQGGSLQEVAKYGMNKECGLLVNASRSIIYAGNGPDFAQKAREEAQKMQQEMEAVLKQHGI